MRGCPPSCTTRSRRIVAVAAIVAALASPSLVAWTGEEAQIWLSPDKSRPTVGTTFNVYVRIRGAENVGSVPFTLLYDPALVQFISAESREGGFLRRDGSSTSFLAVGGSTPAGSTGVIVGLSRLRPDVGVRGKGILCKLTFRARAPGSCRLSFQRASALDPKASPLAARFEGTVIDVRPAP